MHCFSTLSNIFELPEDQQIRGVFREDRGTCIIFLSFSIKLSYGFLNTPSSNEYPQLLLVWRNNNKDGLSGQFFRIIELIFFALLLLCDLVDDVEAMFYLPLSCYVLPSLLTASGYFL